MSLSFLSKKKQSRSLVLLLDIGSSSVGAAFVEIKKGSSPRFLASVRESIPFQGVLSSTTFLMAMMRTLDKVLVSIQLKNIQSVDKTKPLDIFCTLSSPWFILKTRKLNISRPEEFEVNEQNLEEFIDQDIEILKKELKEALPLNDIRIIERKIIQMKLNGYDIKNPYKQRTSNMEMLTTVGVSSNKVIKGIEGKLHRVSHHSAIHFGAFPLAVFNTIRDIFPTEKNLLFLDVTGEATDVSRMENDLLIGTVSFPYGKNFFIREISIRMKTIHEEAETLFSMFLRDELNSVRSTKIAEVISVAEKEWLSKFEKTLTKIAHKQALPSKIFFTTDTELAPFFSRLIAKATSELLLGASFDVQYLDQLIVSKFVSFEAGVVRDPFLVVEAIFAEKLTK